MKNCSAWQPPPATPLSLISGSFSGVCVCICVCAYYGKIYVHNLPLILSE